MRCFFAMALPASSRRGMSDHRSNLKAAKINFECSVLKYDCVAVRHPSSLGPGRSRFSHRSILLKERRRSEPIFAKNSEMISAVSCGHSSCGEWPHRGITFNSTCGRSRFNAYDSSTGIKRSAPPLIMSAGTRIRLNFSCICFISFDTN